jgi:hypothetical protein
MRNTGLGVYITALSTSDLPQETVLCFTFFWTEAGTGENADFSVDIQASA